MVALSPTVTLLRNKLVRQMIADGASTAEMARQFKTSKQYVSAMIRRHNLAKPPPKKLPLNASEKHIVSVARKHRVELTADDIQRI